MADAVTICNQALSYVGDSANMVAIDAKEKSAQAELCNRFYPTAVSTLLDMHDWSFATKRLAVPELPDEEGFGWRKVFQLPSDAIRIIRVREHTGFHDDYHNSLTYISPVLSHLLKEGLDFEIKDAKLYCNAGCALVEYISSNTGVERFSPTFVTALAYYLAQQIVGARVKGEDGQKLSQALFKQFQVALSIAKTRDASQLQKRINFIPSWIKGR